MEPFRMLSEDLAIVLSKQMLSKAILITAPIAAAVLVCGLLISVIQALTQIQDSTLNQIPKTFIAVFLLIICSSWMLHCISLFTAETITKIPEWLR